MRWGLVGRNASALAHGPRLPRPELKVFSSEQAQTFLEAIQGERLEAFFCTAIATGLRRGELLGLRWSDVDLDAGVLAVRQALQRVGKHLRFVEPKSKRSRRRVTLPTFAVRARNRQRDLQASEQRLAGSKWTETGLVFTSSIGTALDERNVRRTFNEILRDAELPGLRLHDLRHTTATLLLTQGVHPRVVMETLGHSQVSLTLDTSLTRSSRPSGGGGPAHARCDWLSDWLSGRERCSTRHSRSRGFFRRSGEPPRNRTENPQIKSRIKRSK